MTVNALLTVKELACYLKLAKKTAYCLSSEGKIPGFKVNGSLQFRKKDIDFWIDNKLRQSSKKREGGVIYV